MKTNNSHIKSEIEKELETLAPSLAKIKKQEPNEVAGYYFTTLSDKVLKRIQEEPTVKPSWIDVLEQYIQQLLSPAVLKISLVLVVVGTIGINLYKYNTNVSTVNFAQLTDEDFELLFADNTSALAGFMLTDADMAQLSSQPAFNTFGATLDDEYFDELLFEDIDDDLILEEIL